MTFRKEDHERYAERYDLVDQKLGEVLTTMGDMWFWDITAARFRNEIDHLRIGVRATAKKHRQLSDRAES